MPRCFHKERTSPTTSPIRNDPAPGRRPLSTPLHGAPGQWTGLGNGRHGQERCRANCAACRSFPTARASSKKSTAWAFPTRRGLPLTGKADFDFYRALPSGGYATGRSAGERTDIGDGDIAPETRGVDFFPYRPGYLRKEPPMAALARVTNVVQRALAQRQILGRDLARRQPVCRRDHLLAQSADRYAVPIVGNSSQRPTAPSPTTATGISSIRSITSPLVSGRRKRPGLRRRGGDSRRADFYFPRCAKSRRAAGGYVATGGHGGIIGRMGHPERRSFRFKPVKRHTHNSLVNLTQLPREVQGSKVQGSKVGSLLSRSKMPRVICFRRRFPKLRSSSMRATCRKIPREMRAAKSIFWRGSTRICAMRRWLDLSPKAQRRLAP